MKKVIILISAMALSLSLANAQQNGNGTAGEGLTVNDGSGPNGNRVAMWASITEAASGNTAILEVISEINAARQELLAARAAADPEMTIEEFQAANKVLIEELKTNVAQVQSWWRANRPDRPAPVVNEDARKRFRANSQTIAQKREQLREMQKTNPDSAECDQLREQLGTLLGERKQLLRNQRLGGGRQSGDGTGTGG